ncbi:hypothetical protein L211DRAFT_51009 [Terfezia boudieri ATCC MYA-4762]|uniref:Uncharacterized protein n=1 Tax=Terfezia boudieri ATCC MYA-4762 TaxID=1051890 RepID=A0A3N4M8E1_9PEZI|nr:hypothetical protein L211DRAFT_51009 [Terfezia boudieri ATCC MYA-4762]
MPAPLIITMTGYDGVKWKVKWNLPGRRSLKPTASMVSLTSAICSLALTSAILSSWMFHVPAFWLGKFQPLLAFFSLLEASGYLFCSYTLAITFFCTVHI